MNSLDGEIGRAEDFIMDDGMWTIRYLIIDTVNWRPGKKSLLRRAGSIASVRMSRTFSLVSPARHQTGPGPQGGLAAEPEL